MKKKIMIVMMLAALMAVPVFAATSDQNQAQNDWFNQMSQNHQKMMQQAVDNGTITTDQATQMNEHMQQMMQNGSMMQNSSMGNCSSNSTK
jgi:Spy/CpxP family protein refolding chaperone